MILPSTSDADVLKKIDELHQPYFSLRLIPDSKTPELPLPDVKKLILNTKVSLRGWDFPHVNPREVTNANGYVFGAVDWNNHLELWRMYQSGQFIYLGTLWDVLPEFQASLRKEMERNFILATGEQKQSVVGLTSFIGLIYSVTEFYVFAARLASALGVESIELKNFLRNIKGWALASGDPSILWHSFYQCRIEEIDLSGKLQTKDLVGDPAREASAAIKHLFELFNWNDASPNMIRQWQDKLIGGRFAI